MKLVWEPLYGVEMGDRSKRKKCLKMKIHESGVVIQFNPVGATLYKKKCNFCLKECFVWEPPLGVKIGVRSQRESCWKRSTYGGSFILSNPVGTTV